MEIPTMNVFRRYLLSHIETYSIIVDSIETNIVEIKDEAFEKNMRILKLPQALLKGTEKISFAATGSSAAITLVTCESLKGIAVSGIENMPIIALSKGQMLKFTGHLEKGIASDDNAFAAVARIAIDAEKKKMMIVPNGTYPVKELILLATKSIQKDLTAIEAAYENGSVSFANDSPLYFVWAAAISRGHKAYVRTDHQLINAYFLEIAPEIFAEALKLARKELKNIEKYVK